MGNKRNDNIEENSDSPSVGWCHPGSYRVIVTSCKRDKKNININTFWQKSLTLYNTWVKTFLMDISVDNYCTNQHRIIKTFPLKKALRNSHPTTIPTFTSYTSLSFSLPFPFGFPFPASLSHHPSPVCTDASQLVHTGPHANTRPQTTGRNETSALSRRISLLPRKAIAKYCTVMDRISRIRYGSLKIPGNTLIESKRHRCLSLKQDASCCCCCCWVVVSHRCILTP